MKRLVRLVLVNWYRLDAESIEIRGHTAVIGPNASGKSSLLDALQTVLVGGDKRQLSLNPSAGERSTRSLRDYCLGVVRDPDNPDLSAEFRPREQAVTYLVLCFQDAATEQETAVGLALHARLEEPRERVDGRFIAPGLGLLLSDVTEQTPDGPVPKPWRRLREELRARCPRFESIPHAGEFVKRVCEELSDGRRYLDPGRFLRSFRNAITFAPIRNVSDFVRGYILEDRPIRVRDLQLALASYREIRTRTREAEERERALSAVNEFYAKAERNERLALAYRWVEQEAAFNALEAQIEPLREEVEGRRRRIRGLEAKAAELGDQREAANQEWAQARECLAASDVAQQRQRIEAQRQAELARRGQVQERLDKARLGLQQGRRLLEWDELLPEGLRETLTPLTTRIESPDSLLQAVWPESPAEVMTAVRRVQPQLVRAAAILTGRYEELVLNEGRLQQELEALKARVARLEAGGSDLSAATLGLQALLADHGIQAAPLCDRVDVADEAWRDTIEAFLGAWREALLVAPDQTEDAVRLYRREGRRLGIHGSRIVNTRKTGEWRGRREPRSLAELMVSDDEHALAYLNRLMGRVRRVEGEAELLRLERAITADGMLADNGAVTRLQRVDPLLGREARARNLEGLKARFHEGALEFAGVQRAKQAAREFRDRELLPFQRHLETLPDLTGLAGERERCDQALRRLDKELASLDSTEYDRLVEQVARLDQRRRELERRQQQVLAEHGTQGSALALEQRALEDKETCLARVAAARSAAAQAPGLDENEAARHLEEMEAQQLLQEDEAARWQAIAEQAGERSQSQMRQGARRRQEAREGVKDYLARWPADMALPSPGDDDHRPLAAWVAGALTDIRETELARYVREAETALREAEHAFRSDFVGRLQENLAQLDDQLKELNRNLRRRPFHGQYYHFEKRPEPDLAAVLDWVRDWTPEEGGDVGGLFDGAADPQHRHREAIRRVQTLLMEAGEGERPDQRLADYRYYYHFDVRMTDADGGNPEYLSRRIGKGSGGEHQSPFYVAIGAALSAAYRLERNTDGRVRGGMALAVFDEAFSKLDVQNSHSALGFLDELGLQVLLAAPDEKYGLMSEHMDTIVNVYRDGGTVHIDADYLKPAARALLGADNPAYSVEGPGEA